MCILLYVKLLWCSGTTQIITMWAPWYMCILLYVKLIWCSGTTQIYGQLEKGGLGICAFFYMLNLISVVVLHKSLVNWRRGPWYMCILVYVSLTQCSSIPWICGQLMGVTLDLGICPFCYM